MNTFRFRIPEEGFTNLQICKEKNLQIYKEFTNLSL